MGSFGNFVYSVDKNLWTRFICIMMGSVRVGGFVIMVLNLDGQNRTHEGISPELDIRQF